MADVRPRNAHVFNSSPEFYNVSVEQDGKRNFISTKGTLALGVREAKTDEEIELGQAGNNDVLISQNGSLVYYGMHTNDLYALYTTGKGLSKLTAAQKSSLGENRFKKLKNAAKKLPEAFPSNRREIDRVHEFADLYGYELRNPEAMAIELKTSWVDSRTVDNPDNYVLTKAVVPTFDRSQPNGPWPVNGTENKTLAMVGMHIVATLNGHPEMIWTTIEHTKNVPDNTYGYYTNTMQNGSYQQGQHSYSSDGSWNFLPSGADAPSSIQANAVLKAKDTSGSTVPSQIVASSEGQAIGAVDVFRVNPWGSLPANEMYDNNTDLVSVNVSVLSQLVPGDVRGNYIQTGGIWSAKGQIPPGYPIIFPTDESDTERNQNPHDTYLRGSLYLANTTMETFFQYKSDAVGDLFHANCFACHGQGVKSADSTPVPTGISHIFDALQPLTPK